MRLQKTALFVCFAASLVPCRATAQQGEPQITDRQRDDARQMLDVISEDIKNQYYDPKLHGIDWAANVKTYRQKIDTAPTLNYALSEVAAAMDVLHDSHTFFLPPPRPYVHSFGWQIGMVGDNCLIFAVRLGSDAEKNGLKPGDQILTVNGFTPTRNNLWKMNFVFTTLRPQLGLAVVVASPNGEHKEVQVAASMRRTQEVRDLTGSGIFDVLRDIENQIHDDRMRWVEIEDVMVLKFPLFAYSESEVDNVMKKARKRSGLVIDLRGNGGGSVETLRAFLGNFFDHDVKIADRVARNKTKAINAHSEGKHAFQNKLVIITDSRSGSASELLARVVQIEKRGLVVGDRSAGAVMEAKHNQYKIGTDTILVYGASITDADLIMTDGKSLEHIGVTPDEVLLPTGADLAAGRDPVLARAVELAGGKISPEAADKLFPIQWPKN
jgi:carboxyl-terminal processing protease